MHQSYDDDREPIIPPGTDNLTQFVTSLWIEKMHREAVEELERKYVKAPYQQAEQQEEFAMFRPYDANPNSPGIDLPYSPTINPTFFTKILVAVGYRPYLLKREDTGETQTVWSKSSDLSRYAEGEATPIKMVKGMEISRYAPVILMDEQDGGTINEHFHQIKG